MSDSESGLDTARYTRRLARERDDLLAASEQSRPARQPVELDQQSVGRLSRMDALQNQAMARSAQDRRSARLRAIAAAMERLDTGEFGYCGDCGDRIATPRLDLDPTVTRCISCAR